MLNAFDTTMAEVWRRLPHSISVGIVNPWEQLLEGIELPFHPDLAVPELTEVALPIPHPEAVTDVEATAHRQVVDRLAGSVDKGMTVAVGAGSRGLVERVGLLRGAISGLRELGANPLWCRRWVATAVPPPRVNDRCWRRSG